MPILLQKKATKLWNLPQSDRPLWISQRNFSFSEIILAQNTYEMTCALFTCRVKGNNLLLNNFHSAI